MSKKFLHNRAIDLMAILAYLSAGAFFVNAFYYMYWGLGLLAGSIILFLFVGKSYFAVEGSKTVNRVMVSALLGLTIMTVFTYVIGRYYLMFACFGFLLVAFLLFGSHKLTSLSKGEGIQ